MANPSTHEITQLLVAWNDGDTLALERLAPLVHGELHRLAQRYMAGERPGHVLQATALVNEAYLRLIDWKNVQWKNRAHFYGLAARIMRRILVDFARSQRREKRGGDAMRVSLSEVSGLARERSPDLIALDDALQALEKLDPRACPRGRIVLFCRVELQRSRRIARCLGRHGEARSEPGTGMALPRAVQRWLSKIVIENSCQRCCFAKQP